MPPCNLTAVVIMRNSMIWAVIPADHGYHSLSESNIQIKAEL
jgi:hypothetical protein